MSNHYYGYPTHLKELSPAENKQLKKDVVNAVKSKYGATIDNVKYLDYRHKIKRQREKEQLRLKTEKAKARSQSIAGRYGRNFIGIVPLLIIVTFVWFVAGTYEQVTKQVIVGDQTYEYEMVTSESANAIGNRALNFIEDLYVSVGEVGNNFKDLFVTSDGSFSGGVLNLITTAINYTAKSFNVGIKIVDVVVSDEHAGYDTGEIQHLVQWERDNGYMGYWDFMWLQIKYTFVWKINDIYDIWDWHPDNPHLHENQEEE